MKFTVSTREYLKINCWKIDSDRFRSFWDMDRWSQKSGGGDVYSGRRVYSAKYGMVFLQSELYMSIL